MITMTVIAVVALSLIAFILLTAPRSPKPSPVALIEAEYRAIASVHGSAGSTVPNHVTVYVAEKDIRSYMAANRSKIHSSSPATGYEAGYYVTIAR